MTDANTTDLPACASQDGAHPPIALTADAGAQTGRPVVWQRRNHNITQVGCDRCNRTVSHFRVRLSEHGAALWICVDCAEVAGIDIYQPAHPIDLADRRMIIRDIDDLPIHGDLEDRAEQVVRHISHDVRRNGWSWGEGVSW